MPDSRTYIKLDDHLPENPKILRAGDEAGWLYVMGLCYCSRQMTDGVIPRQALPKLVNKHSDKLAAILIEVGLWEERAENFVVHDYLEHQRSREQIEDERRKARERAAKSRRKAGGVTEPEAVSEVEAGSGLSNPATSSSSGDGDGAFAALEEHFKSQGFIEEDVGALVARLRVRESVGKPVTDPMAWMESALASMVKARSNNGDGSRIFLIDDIWMQHIEGEWREVDLEDA